MINFDRIEENIFIGSTPRNLVDVKRLSDQLKITAVLSLQSDADYKTHSINIREIAAAYEAAGIDFYRHQITDFDAQDMARKLVDPVRNLGQLMDQNKRVYVHCNAGICRASATVLGYLHIYRGMGLEEGLAYIKSKRPIANPYMDAVKVAMDNFPREES